MNYTGQDISTYIDQYTTLFSQLERMGNDAAVPETHKAPMLLASITPSCLLESTAAALRIKDASELTWDYVATTLIDEYNAKHFVGTSSSSKNGGNRRKKKRKDKSNLYNKIDHTESEDSDLESTVQALTVALKSAKSANSNSHLHCEFCDKSGHTEDRCYLNPDNSNNKIPPKLREICSSKATERSSGGSGASKKAETASALVQKATVLPPKDNRSYADSSATGHFFHSKSLFVNGSIKPCNPTTVLLVCQ